MKAATGYVVLLNHTLPHTSLIIVLEAIPFPMSTERLTGLALTRTERIIVIALSYIFCAPVLYKNVKKLYGYVKQTSEEARRQVDDEDRVRNRREQVERAEALLRDLEQLRDGLRERNQAQQ